MKRTIPIILRNTRHIARRRFCTIENKFENKFVKRRPETLDGRLWVKCEELYVNLEHASGWSWVHTRTKVRILQVLCVIGTAVTYNWKWAGLNWVKEPEEPKKLEFSFEENAKMPGVEVHPSGLQYKIVARGSGKEVSRENPHVRIDIFGYLTDLETLCVTPQRQPAMCFKHSNVFHGLKLGLKMMREGDVMEFYIPSHLGYRNYGYIRSFPVTEPSICRVELLEVSHKQLKIKRRTVGHQNAFGQAAFGGFGFG